MNFGRDGSTPACGNRDIRQGNFAGLAKLFNQETFGAFGFILQVKVNPLYRSVIAEEDVYLCASPGIRPSCQYA